jgi:hypothetical protein
MYKFWSIFSQYIHQSLEFVRPSIINYFYNVNEKFSLGSDDTIAKPGLLLPKQGLKSPPSHIANQMATVPVFISMNMVID